MSKILIVEDEESIADLEKDYLELSGFEVEIENQGDTGLVRAVKENFDLLILDLMLPEVDGFEICREVREKKDIPIIMVSAKKDDIDKIRGLGLGADDYMTKPFSNRELQARVKAILRRTDLTIENQEAEAAPTEIVIGDLQILTDAFVVKKHGEELDLTHREFELLHHLATHIGQVMTREHLLETVWGYDYFGDVRTVDVTIRRLREKIEDIPSRPEYILTRRGVGYYMRNND